MTTTVWKVVRAYQEGLTLESETLLSLFSGSWVTTYKIGMVTRPRKEDGPLAAFRTLEEAKLERGRSGHGGRTYRIYQAEATLNRRAKKLWYRWQDAEGVLRKCVHHGGLPKGTVLCSSIELTKEVV